MAKIDNYIDKEVKKGFSYDDIRVKLKKAGYSKKAINDGIRAHSLSARGAGKIVSLHATTIVFLVVVLVVLVFAVFLLSKIPFGKFKESTEFFTEKLSIPSEFQDAIDACHTQSDRDICLLKLAKEYDSFGPCDGIVSAFLRDSCVNGDWRKDDCSFESLIGENPGHCRLKKEIWDDYDVDVDEYCDLSTMTIYQCRIELAKSMENPGICEGDSRCKYLIPLIKEDPNLCLGDSLCLTNYASVLNDSSSCHLIREENQVDTDYKIKDCFNLAGSSLDQVKYINTEREEFFSDSKIDVQEFTLLIEAMNSGSFEAKDCALLTGLSRGISMSDYCFWMKSFRSGEHCARISNEALQTCCLDLSDPSITEEGETKYAKCGLPEDVFISLSG